MGRFFIKDETVHAAFDVLAQSVEAGAIARAMRERREDERRAKKAAAFLQASGSVAEREARSLLDDEYRAACEAYYEAVEMDERWRAERSKAEAIIQAWQTSSANQRAMRIVG